MSVGTVRTAKPTCRRKKCLRSCSIYRYRCGSSPPRLPRKPRKTRCRYPCARRSTIAKSDPSHHPHTHRRSTWWSRPKNKTAGRRDNCHRPGCCQLCRSAPPMIHHRRRRRSPCRNNWGLEKRPPAHGRHLSQWSQHDLSRVMEYGPIAQRPMPSRWCSRWKRRSAIRAQVMDRPRRIGQPRIPLHRCWPSPHRHRPIRSNWVAWLHAPGAPKVRSRSH